MAKFLVGDVAIYPIVQFHYTSDPLKFFPQLAAEPQPDSAWYMQEPFVDAATGWLKLDMGGFLVETPERKIMVDLGMGNDKPRANPQFRERNDRWLEALADLGTTPDQIDTVIYTHLHIDHVGFSAQLRGGRWEPTFVNARHLTTRVELDFWTGPAAAHEMERYGDYLADSIAPLIDAQLLDLVQPDLQITTEVRLLPAFGHTPGNICVEVSSNGERAIFSGDMIHHPIQLVHPSWSTGYCIDMGHATTARQALIDEIVDTKTLLIPAHFPGSLPCRLTTTDEGYSFEPAEAVA